MKKHLSLLALFVIAYANAQEKNVTNKAKDTIIKTNDTLKDAADTIKETSETIKDVTETINTTLSGAITNT